MSAIERTRREVWQAELLDVKRLPQMSAADLAEALRRHFDGLGGLSTDDEREIARELVRRARRLEALEQQRTHAA